MLHNLQSSSLRTSILQPLHLQQQQMRGFDSEARVGEPVHTEIMEFLHITSIQMIEHSTLRQ